MKFAMMIIAAILFVAHAAMPATAQTNPWEAMSKGTPCEDMHTDAGRARCSDYGAKMMTDAFKNMQVQQDQHQNAVIAPCVISARQTDQTFDAYVSENTVNMSGTANAIWQFRKCMAASGNPLH